MWESLSLLRSTVISFAQLCRIHCWRYGTTIYFTLDEALAQVLDDEYDWLSGARDGGAGDRESDDESTSTTSHLIIIG